MKTKTNRTMKNFFTIVFCFLTAFAAFAPFAAFSQQPPHQKDLFEKYWPDAPKGAHYRSDKDNVSFLMKEWIKGTKTIKVKAIEADPDEFEGKRLTAPIWNPYDPNKDPEAQKMVEITLYVYENNPAKLDAPGSPKRK